MLLVAHLLYLQCASFPCICNVVGCQFICNVVGYQFICNVVGCQFVCNVLAISPANLFRVLVLNQGLLHRLKQEGKHALITNVRTGAGVIRVKKGNPVVGGIKL